MPPLKSTWQRKMDLDAVKQYRRVKKILKANGYLKPAVKPMTEAQKVKLEGRA